MQRWTLIFGLFGALTFGGYQALINPKTPLSSAWNPTQPFDVNDPVTPLTSWKLGRAAEDAELCITALQNAAAQFELEEDFSESDICHIRPRVRLHGVGQANLVPVETRCATALRLAMWERLDLQEAARSILGSELIQIEHLSSYSCRNVRLPEGEGRQPSTHATADAIDITGFAFADGRTVRLLNDWGGDGPEGEFLLAVRDSACVWFKTALGPEFNDLHKDHFHLQSRGFGTCR